MSCRPAGSGYQSSSRKANGAKHFETPRPAASRARGRPPGTLRVEIRRPAGTPVANAA